MPNRVIREGFLDSEAIHNLSDSAECLFHRLLLAADDAGRFDGRTEVLRARLFPLDVARRSKDVETQLGECIKERLVFRYEWEKKPFLQILRWQRSSNSQTSKYPWTDGTFAITFVQLQTRDGKKDFIASSIPSASHPDGIGGVPAHLIGDGDGDGDEVVYGDGNGSAAKPQPPATDEAQEVVNAWNAQDRLPKVMSLSDARKRSLKARLAEPFFRDNYSAGIARMAASAFCRGEKGGSWKATFDFLLQPDTLTRVMEGKYDDRGASTSIDKGTYALTSEETAGSTWNPLTDD